MDTRRRMKKTEMEARRGSYGAWRRDFCREYGAIASRICREAYEGHKTYLDSLGTAITCRRGCAYCCSHYISISLGHGLVIADYLYAHPEALEAFLGRYEKWRHATAGAPALRTLEQYTTFSAVVRGTPQALLDDYAGLGVPCPFLAGGACSIYPVRPICCASHFSISPPQRCREGSPEQPLICEATPSPEGLRRLAALGEPALWLHQETMPSLVYRMLTEGLPEIMRQLGDMAGA